VSDYPFTDVDALLDALQALLEEIAADRLVTQELNDFHDQPSGQRENGVYTILPGTRTGYNYEHRPGDLPRLQIFVYFDLPGTDKTTGKEIQALENTIVRELETLANLAPHVAGLEELTLESITPSAQTMRPDASVLGVFIYGVDR
jgi:hypothetical protein